ncbi:primosomal replication protein [Vibrio sp. 99-70-13A1]|uniref:primosomal replication protein n=1 Tax=Vibrio sp. 99-70-13A1 TaxID=2607601 RepID=UPI0014939253|nr:primosomal replication protein [Vibrio sp. 99-70-13A1]NOH95286.1 hypothetical protein [Vibrio sp. 99-70-13A1]
MSQLSALKTLLDTLIGHCSQVDKARGRYHQPLFDRTLFKSGAHFLLPCALETQSTYQTILREQASSQLTPTRASYLSEKLMNQIAAIQRELANHDLRQDRPLKSAKSPNQLYNDLAQHQDWHRRLTQLVTQRQQAWANAHKSQKAGAEKALNTAKERLERCSDSMKDIERLINLDKPRRHDD